MNVRHCLRPAACRAGLSVLSLFLFSVGAVRAEEPVSLMSGKEGTLGWTFNNGAEFPGATGGLTIDEAAAREGRTTMKLTGDFTKGGNYVQAGRKVPNVDIHDLVMWIRNPDGERFTIRLNDAGGQTHQIDVTTERTDDWQRLVLPLEKFFANRGKADAVTSVVRYEHWGGAKDGKWHGPATGIFLLLGKRGDTKVRTMWLNDIAIVPPAPKPQVADVKTTVRLDELNDGQHDWRFTLGEEFKGAKGSLAVVPDQPAAGQSSFKLSGDFTGGGAYVAMVKDLKPLNATDIAAIELRAKTENAANIGVQLVDATGQTHQKRLKVTADGQWHDVAIKPNEIAGGEHWGGKNDGKFHGAATQVVLSVTTHSDEKGKQPNVLLTDIRADATVPGVLQTALAADFEKLTELDSDWTKQGDAAIDAKSGYKSQHALVLRRTLDDIEKPCSVTGPKFTVSPGQWQIGVVTKADLRSDDASYSGVVDLEAFDAAGKPVERFTLVDTYGQRNWTPVDKKLELPKSAATARFHAQLNKTYGSFWIDDLSARFVAPAKPKDDRISRVLFSTAAVGNLLLPDDPRRVTITVEATKPLAESQRSVDFVVRDYWGAEHTEPATVQLGAGQQKSGHWEYEAVADLSAAPLEIGRYYEVHASVPQAGGEPFRNYTSLAILPEAATKQYKPEDVPFTSRNWDNRYPPYIYLSDRLGLRTCGIWGGWSSKPPYKPEAPTLELIEKLHMGWISGTPANEAEHGKSTYSQEALREGLKNFLDKYGKLRPLTINLGNEPHGTGEKVRRNVESYKLMYEEIKKYDPSIFVLATAVEPNEEYFKLGYGKYCDAFDFHVYETPESVRRSIGEYRELMKKYDVEKPIWSTEIGLNSQGQTRLVVADSLIKKFATFFAAGGANISWFAIVYPDAEGKSFGSSGDSHNVFDCRYNRFCPRLDAIAYYNMVNGIAIKKFVEERVYQSTVNATLFRDADGHALQVLWADKGRHDVFIPLTKVNDVQVIRIDGSRSALHAAGEGVSLTVDEHPLLLLYDSVDAKLPHELGPARATLAKPPASISLGGSATINVTLGDSGKVAAKLVAPPFWKVESSPAGVEKTAQPNAAFVLTAPKVSDVRQADLVITLDNAKGQRQGELYYRLPVDR